MDDQSPHYEAPQQKRSRETMTRILDAAAELLEDKSFDETSINEIVSRAECSVGAFYGRFKDKDGLLHALDERYFSQFGERIKQFFESFDQAPGTLEEVIQETVRVIVDIHQHQRGLMRTLILRARTSADDRFRQREAALNSAFPRYQDLLLGFSDEIEHPEPEKAVAYGFFQLFTSIREKLLWGDALPAGEFSEAEFSAEAGRAFLAYLTYDERKEN
ncbi:MAG: TetR/AcrR family transcriptional regulator [Anaerolineales bacterium]